MQWVAGERNSRHHAEFAAGEEDSGAAVFEAAKGSGVGLQGLDFEAEAFGQRGDDLALDVGGQATCSFAAGS